MDSDITQDVSKKFLMIVDNKIKDSVQSEDSRQFIQLRHPRSDEAFMVYVSFEKNKILVYEVLKFEEQYRSWFIDDEVQSDGSLYLITPIDLRFIILPYLLKKSSQYMQIEEILSDEEYDNLQVFMSPPNVIESLRTICDVKDIGDTCVLKYSEEKCLDWLKLKIEKLSNYLKDRPQSVEYSACASNYVKSLKEEKATTDLVAYSCGMFSEYLPNEVEEKLKKILGIKEVVMRKIENQKRKSNSSAGPNEDYTETIESTAKKSGGKDKKDISQSLDISHLLFNANDSNIVEQECKNADDRDEDSHFSDSDETLEKFKESIKSFETAKPFVKKRKNPYRKDLDSITNRLFKLIIRRKKKKKNALVNKTASQDLYSIQEGIHEIDNKVERRSTLKVFFQKLSFTKNKSKNKSCDKTSAYQLDNVQGDPSDSGQLVNGANRRRNSLSSSLGLKSKTRIVDNSPSFNFGRFFYKKNQNVSTEFTKNFNCENLQKT
ncbi:DgyrCDS7405 [Dimorphilus gyrociliatus]|uniref:Ribonuclease H2 subunit B n=1 Tax=Dimorphilus gyrociliatus TaxID=2664684 RepID=A0A7I8VSL4_9ANNE|nr:DgyrCDS7405 [Dimorphilus gyrociliatus]